jgi:serine/threonine protein phosphatase PrpC
MAIDTGATTSTSDLVDLTLGNFPKVTITESSADFQLQQSKSDDVGSLSPANNIELKNSATTKPNADSMAAGFVNSRLQMQIFNLPNCRVGNFYQGKITSNDNDNIFVLDVKIPNSIGLTFEANTQTVSGVPLLDGEFDLNLQWKYRSGYSNENYSGSCRLISNPDPRSLWKVIEPSNSLPYSKSHLDKKIINADGYKIVAASRRGRSHEHSGSFRDDDFYISANEKDGWSVIIVADGAGSAKYSREGSRIACGVAGDFLVNNLALEFGSNIDGQIDQWEDDTSSQNFIGSEFHYFFHKMAGAAINSIEKEASVMNAAVKDYSTTLLALVSRKTANSIFVASFWMGDGAIVAYGQDGSVKLMGVPDGGEFAGQTRFLDRQAISDISFGKRVRVGKFKDMKAMILMTDGVSDPYFESDSQLSDPKCWELLWKEIEPFLSDSSPDSKLLEWLHFFKPGHHDDRTIALMW